MMAKWLHEITDKEPIDRMRRTPDHLKRPSPDNPKVRYVREWKCDGCGEWFCWNDGSSSYGSIKMMEDGEWDKVWIACSQECAAKRK